MTWLVDLIVSSASALDLKRRYIKFCFIFSVENQFKMGDDITVQLKQVRDSVSRMFILRNLKVKRLPPKGISPVSGPFFTRFSTKIMNWFETL